MPMKIAEVHLYLFGDEICQNEILHLGSWSCWTGAFSLP